MKTLITRLVVTISVSVLVFSTTPAYALNLPATGGTPASTSEKKDAEISVRASQANKYTIPGKKGTLTSNAWRSSIGRISGNTLQWDYQVSAVYTGKKKVQRIRTSWYASATLRNSATISLGLSNSGGSVGVGASWRSAKTKVKYWENNNGAKVADYRTNIIVSPRKDYRVNTISIVNTATVKLQGDAKTYRISAGA